MPDGTLLASPWAYNHKGRPLSDDWVLGNLAEDPLSVILNTAKVIQFNQHQNDNFGHCKVFAWLNGKSSMLSERFFEQADPLYLG
jgi:hypothetical protein